MSPTVFRKGNYTNCITKFAESHFAKYNGKCRYIFEAALGENRTKGAFQIIIGITDFYFLAGKKTENN